MKKITILIFALVWMLCRPAGAEAAGAPEYGSITIYNQNDAGQPVSGVEYTIWQVDESGGYRPAAAAEAKGYLLEDTRQSKKTGSGGKVVFASLPAGIYYVSESDLGGMNLSVFANPPFLVEIPVTNEDAAGWISDVEVSLKNQALGIDQFVNSPGEEHFDTQDVNRAKHRPVGAQEKFGYTLAAYVPRNIGATGGESYAVTDRINKDMICYPATLKVYLAASIETKVQDGTALTEGQHYEKSFDQASNLLAVRLTQSGMDLLNQRNETAGEHFLLLKFDCQLSDEAPNGINLYSEATLTYQKGTAAKSSAFSLASAVPSDGETILTAQVADEPEVHTGQIGIVKADAGKKEQRLAGAKFGIAASKSQAEAGEYISTGSTDENGSLVFRGLSYGQPGDSSEQNGSSTTYWLVETEAPAGYSRVKEPFEVKFQYQQDDDGEFYFAKVKVYNQSVGTTGPDDSTKAGGSQGARQVKTGDSSVVLLMTALLFISMAVILIIWKNKRISKQLI